MGPLTKRIRLRRAQVTVTILTRRAERDARIAVALNKDEDRDGGLLIHSRIERGLFDG